MKKMENIDITKLAVKALLFNEINVDELAEFIAGHGSDALRIALLVTNQIDAPEVKAQVVRDKYICTLESYNKWEDMVYYSYYVTRKLWFKTQEDADASVRRHDADRVYNRSAQSESYPIEAEVEQKYHNSCSLETWNSCLEPTAE